MSQERGRRHNRIRSLSPPQMAKSRSRSTSKERLRSRDPSPFSIDSRLNNSNYIMKNPFTNPLIGRDTNSPIPEDDENSDVELRPILPQFTTSSTHNLLADSSELEQVPLPLKNIHSGSHEDSEVSKELEYDFQRQFKKDTKMKTLKKNHNNNSDSNHGSNSRININDKKITGDDSSSDYSTDSLQDDDADDDHGIGSMKKNNEISLANEKFYRVDSTLVREGSSNINELQLPQQTYQPDEPESSFLDMSYENLSKSDANDKKKESANISSQNSSLINEALQNIDDEQNEAKPSSVLRWLGHIPPKFSLGHIMASSSKDRPKERDEERDPVNPTNMRRSESSSSAKRLFSKANHFVHNKVFENKFYDDSKFDDILDSVGAFAHGNRKETEHNETYDKYGNHSNSGVTYNLMQLYNQFSDDSSSEDIPNGDDSEYDEEFDDSASNFFEKKPGNLPSKVAERVRKFKNNGLFSREGSRDRFLSRSRSKEPELSVPSDIKKQREMEDTIVLPKFNAVKEDKKLKKIKRKAKKDRAARITVHIVDLMHRQEFLLTLCKAFMKFGAPNHRLEEYMTLTAQVLEVEATFIYFPGTMIVNFSDPVTRTSDLKLVRVGQGLNLNKLDQANDLFESVVYDRIGVDEASERLNELFESKEYLNSYWIILLYGLSSTFILIFFNGAWLDMIPSFCMGALIGFLECFVAPKNAIYSSVFEIGSAILLSFIGRAVGSIANGKYFCFSAVVLSGLCMLLPGYMILRGALEIQSKSIVSGVVGMFYAIIYSLFLGFGLMLGSALYGWIDSNAISETTCSNMGRIGNIWSILFIPLFNIVLSMSSQARFHQLSVMTIIGCAGYVVLYFSSLRFSLTQLNSALGSFTVGVLSNVYDRWFKQYKRFGHCSTQFTSMITGIFDLVPGGVAAKNTLSSGLIQLEKARNGTSDATDYSALSFGVSMIEIAIGITVGLFMSALVVYPFGKLKKSNNTIGL